MNRPQRIALTAAIGAVAIPATTALVMAIQEPLNALLWQISFLFPASLLSPIPYLATGLVIACLAAFVGFAVTRIWMK